MGTSHKRPYRVKLEGSYVNPMRSGLLAWTPPPTHFNFNVPCFGFAIILGSYLDERARLEFEEVLGYYFQQLLQLLATYQDRKVMGC